MIVIKEKEFLIGEFIEPKTEFNFTMKLRFDGFRGINEILLSDNFSQLSIPLELCEPREFHILDPHTRETHLVRLTIHTFSCGEKPKVKFTLEIPD